MTSQDIRIAMAEIDGFIKTIDGFYYRPPFFDINQLIREDNLPNYPEDLNAIAEFRKRHITNTMLWNKYLSLLGRVQQMPLSVLASKWQHIRILVDSSCLAHCEALIKTLAPEKWKE